ncbi:MAG: type III-B CRISPR module-associated protein Cmr5 [candidate division WOR-3 bacterium]
MTEKTLITKLEMGRAEFAYKCALQGVELKSKVKINDEWYEDDKYAPYVKKLPSMILSNGLGQTLAFVVSKKKKTKDKHKPGDEQNPKNAYDLIYKQLTDYLKSDSAARIQMPKDKRELIEWVITLDSRNYSYVTEEILAFLKWLKRFAEGMTETMEEEQWM